MFECMNKIQYSAATYKKYGFKTYAETVKINNKKRRTIFPYTYYNSLEFTKILLSKGL